MINLAADPGINGTAALAIIIAAFIIAAAVYVTIVVLYFAAWALAAAVMDGAQRLRRRPAPVREIHPVYVGRAAVPPPGRQLIDFYLDTEDLKCSSN